MKCVIVHHGTGIGGASRSMSRLANRLAKSGEDVHVIFMNDSEAVGLVDSEIVKVKVLSYPLRYFNHTSRWYKVHEFPIIVWQAVSWIFVAFYLAPKELRKLSPDVLYLNSSVLTDWGFAGKVFSKSRVVYHVREALSNGYLGIRNRLISYLISFSSDRVIFLSEHNKRRFSIEPRHSQIIYNYVFESFSCVGENKSYDVCYVGGSGAIKGIQSVRDLVSHSSSSKFSFLLLGYYSEEDKAFFKPYPNVRLEGVVKSPLEYISKCTFLIFPATTPHFPRPVIEAFATRTVPIVNDLEGMDEIVRDGVTGWIVDFSNIDDVLALIQETSESTNSEMTSAGYEDYTQRFSIQNEIRILDLLKEEYED